MTITHPGRIDMAAVNRAQTHCKDASHPDRGYEKGFETGFDMDRVRDVYGAWPRKSISPIWA